MVKAPEGTYLNVFLISFQLMHRFSSIPKFIQTFQRTT